MQKKVSNSQLSHSSILTQEFGRTLDRKFFVEVYIRTEVTPNPCESGSGFMLVTTAENSEH